MSALLGIILNMDPAFDLCAVTTGIHLIAALDPSLDVEGEVFTKQELARVTGRRCSQRSLRDPPTVVVQPGIASVELVVVVRVGEWAKLVVALARLGAINDAIAVEIDVAIVIEVNDQDLIDPGVGVVLAQVVAALVVAVLRFEAQRRRLGGNGTVVVGPGEYAAVVAGIGVVEVDVECVPTAIRTTLQGLRKQVGNDEIIAVVEPRSHTMSLGTLRQELKTCCAPADQVFWFRGENIRWDGLPEAVRPFVCGFAGYGAVSRGAQEIYDLLPVLL